MFFFCFRKNTDKFVSYVQLMALFAFLANFFAKNKQSIYIGSESKEKRHRAVLSDTKNPSLFSLLSLG